MLKITMIIVITFFTIVLTPHERASANPLAVGGALYLGGAGVYVIGAVAVAGIVGLSGCSSCQEDIEAHAQRTWDGSTQLAKDAMDSMISASVSAGNGLVEISADFASWFDSELDGLIDSIISGQGHTADISNVYHYQYYAGGSIQESVSIDATKDNVHLIANGIDAVKAYVNPVYGIEITDRAGVVHALQATYSNGYTAYKDHVRSITSAETFAVIMANYGLMVTYMDNAQYSTFQSGISNTREAWQDMQDAGLVLPTDNARAMYNNQPVTYDPATDAYAGIDGVAVPRDGITFDYQRPHWKTKEDLIALGGAAAGASAGLYIDGWTDATGSTTSSSTYDPATDITTTTSTTTGSTTNVTTGETVTTDAVTTSTTATGDTTSVNNPTPEGGTPKTQTGKANRWGKLVTTKFPFSLPWDLFFILSFLNADPKTPVFSIDERINKRENVEGIQIKFDIDLSFLDPYVPWFRRFIVLGFALFLILNTRKLLGGAQ